MSVLSGDSRDLESPGRSFSCCWQDGGNRRSVRGVLPSVFSRKQLMVHKVCELLQIFV